MNIQKKKKKVRKILVKIKKKFKKKELKTLGEIIPPKFWNKQF